jgi:hypothetical protein
MKTLLWWISLSLFQMALKDTKSHVEYRHQRRLFLSSLLSFYIILILPRGKLVSDRRVPGNSEWDASAIFRALSCIAAAELDAVDVVSLFAFELLDDEQALGVVAVTVEGIAGSQSGARIRQTVAIEKRTAIQSNYSLKLVNSKCIWKILRKKSA